jgi:hypothetical protein
MKITYFNSAAGKRSTLIDQIPQEQATRILTKFRNQGEPLFYMPDIQIEPDDEGDANTSHGPSSAASGAVTAAK